MRIVLALLLVTSAHAQLNDAISWRYGHAEHVGTKTPRQGVERVTEWPVEPCGHPGHEQRGLGPRPTDEQLEALRLEYRASPEYAAKQAASQDRERERVDIPSHEETVRQLEDLTEVLAQEGVIRADSVPAKARTRINRRRARRGLEPL